MIVTRPLADLIEDFDLYPRNRVDSGHVSDLLRAIRSGATIPPPVVDEKTGLIIDGFHRTRAFRKFLGPEGEIEVDERDYKNRREMFIAAVEMNSAHGRKLDRHDQARIVHVAQKLRISKSIIAVNLHVTEAIVEKLKVRVVVNSDTQEVVPNKRGGEWLNETELTTEQIEEGIRPCRSLEVGRLAIELNRLLNQGLVNWADERVTSNLRKLCDRLTEALASEAV